VYNSATVAVISDKRQKRAMYTPLERGGDCVHYWIIAVAAGPQSNGVCRRCKASRQFANWTDHPRGINIEDGKAYRWRDISIREDEK